MIYLLRFTFPLGNERHKAEFHIGYTSRKSIEERLQEHRDCRGARITAAAVERTSPTVEPCTLVWSVKGDRCDERMLKRRKRHADLARTWEAR